MSRGDEDQVMDLVSANTNGATKLGDIADIIVGFPFRSEDYAKSNEGYRLLRGDNLVQGALRWDDVKRWPMEKLVPKHSSYLLTVADVVVAMDRPWIEAGLKFAQIREGDLPALLVQRTACLRARKGTNQDYLRYLLASREFTEYVKSVQTGTAVPHISATQIAKFPILPLSEKAQQVVSDVLRPLDDKIALNRQINQTLEAMAQALFRSWFVDFDPVKAKVAARREGRDPLRAAMGAISGKTDADLDALPNGQYDELATSAALFPDELVESELGEIPRGWGANDLATCFVLNPTSWTEKMLPGSVRYIDLASAKNGEILNVQVVEGGEIPSRARRILEVGDTVVGTVRPGNRSFAYIGESGLTGSTGFAVLRPKDPSLREFVYLAATTDENIARLAHLADGGAYPAVGPELIGTDRRAIPDERILREFHRVVSPFFLQTFALRTSSLHLAEIRDALLPKLLSGELQVSYITESEGTA